MSASSSTSEPLPGGDLDATANPHQTTFRTVVTLLLITHFTALFIALATNAYPLSPIRNALTAVRVFDPYLDLFSLNLAYNFHLTNASEEDVDHFFEFTLTDPATATTRTLPLVGVAAFPQIRRQRLMQYALTAIPGEGEDPILAHAVSQALLRQQGIESGQHRLRIVRRMLVMRTNAGHPDRSLSDPEHENRLETAYEANVLIKDGEVSLVRVVDESQRAEVRTPAE